ncbi:MAG: aldo/keto reductase [Patescibacteria group bacterium]|jgi:2,5-diketo-D-gluconate reductase B
MKKLKLNDETKIPIIGLGTWQLHGDNCVRAVEEALEVGYRHLDTAEAYDNQVEVGRGIKNIGLSREKIFITSKVWMTHLKKDQVEGALNKTLEELDTEYLDLYLIHWPNRSVPIEETLEAMTELKRKNLIKAIGVSNFTINHLKDALKTGMEVSNNQVEFHPSLNQEDLKEFCDENGITLTAYSPIAQGRDLNLEIIEGLSQKYKRSRSQVILRWLIQKEIIVIPRSENPVHIRDNYESLNWEMESSDIDLIDSVDRLSNRIVNPLFGDFNY